MPWALDEQDRVSVVDGMRSVVGQRLQAVRYVELLDVDRRDRRFDAVDFGVELDFDGIGTWNATWETFDGLEGMTLRPGSLIGRLRSRSGVSVDDVTRTTDVTRNTRWSSLIGEPVAEISLRWLDCGLVSEAGRLVPCVDAFLLRFNTGQVVVGLGDCEQQSGVDVLVPAADNLVVLFDAELADLQPGPQPSV
jgi:hypothetical protein